MAFLRKKSAPRSNAGRAPLIILADEDGGKSLAFGLTWRAVASRNGTQAEAAGVARAAGATHLIFKQQQYGYGAVPADAVGQIHPAAQVAARQHGGDGLYAIRIEAGIYWLAVIRGGQPSAVDRVIHADNDVTVLDLAQEEIESAVGDEVHYTVYTNIESHGLAGKVNGLSADDLLMMAAGDDDLLEPLPRSSSILPKPVLYTLLIAAAVGIGNKAWTIHQDRERARLARMNVVPEEPPEQAWARVTSRWAADHAAADSGGLTAPRAALGRTPILWGGWMLESATCSAVPAQGAAARGTSAAAGTNSSGASRAWSCAARYLRPATGRVNRDMGEIALPGWSVQYQGLDTIVASWSVQQPAELFKFEALRSVAFHQVETVSRLQNVLPAFGTIGAIKFSSVAFPPPKKPDGTSYPIVASVPQLQAGEISAKGPLRSVDALIDVGVEADWTQLRIGFVPNASGTAMTLKSSSITAEVKGVIYAKN